MGQDPDRYPAPPPRFLADPGFHGRSARRPKRSPQRWLAWLYEIVDGEDLSNTMLRYSILSSAILVGLLVVLSHS
jgi:hypothetical protein